MLVWMMYKIRYIHEISSGETRRCRTSIRISEAQADSLKKVVGGAAVFSGYDSGLHTILLEESEAYFAGDKTLDETVEIMQKRAVLYMNEKIK